MLNAKDPMSAKRLVTLIVSAHFILASFIILFIANYVIFYVPKGKVDLDLLDLLKEILKYDFYIIVSGLAFITVDGATSAFVEWAKTKFGMVGKLMDQQSLLPTAEEKSTQTPE